MLRSKHWAVWLFGAGLWTLAAALLLRVVVPFAVAPFERKRVVCDLCGARELRTEYGPILLASTDLPSVGAGWWTDLAGDHDHEWHDVGCAQGIGGVSCTIFAEPDLFLSTLPRFRDQVLARKVAARLAELEPQERWREHVDAQRISWLEALVLPEEGRPPAIEIDRQSEVYASWRADHPRWDDLLPPTLQASNER
jgi:hypothetical protein